MLLYRPGNNDFDLISSDMCPISVQYAHLAEHHHFSSGGGRSSDIGLIFSVEAFMFLIPLTFISTSQLLRSLTEVDVNINSNTSTYSFGIPNFRRPKLVTHCHHRNELIFK